MHSTEAIVTTARRCSLPPLSLYIHLPWCVSKCPYCDFNSHVAQSSLNQKLYIDALIADLECDLPYLQNRPLSSLFIGGGTPTLFSADMIASLLTRVKDSLRLKPQCEITLEANPESADFSKLRDLREAGINRISIGIQSLNDQLLARIGRAHDAAQSLQAFENARRAGFANINCDLMFGLPEQTSVQALADLAGVIRLKPEHISWYQLTIEPNTFFYTDRPRLPDDDTIWQLQSEGITQLEASGYSRYEVSAYSRARPCSHNLNYWQFGDYLGIGAGAHGKLTLAAENRIIRTRKHRSPERYMAKATDGQACVEIRELSASEASFEFLLNALRLTDGFAKTLFNRTGLANTTLERQLARFIDKRWIISDGRYFKPSSYGMRFLNEILEDCLPDG
ncbi:MAG: radical SAM family heme chaperone HemW [Gammaproteobacteria bacterium]|nr:radical SAM family heme chaperone HemW [Gammaproteobacteria bacterium]